MSTLIPEPPFDRSEAARRLGVTPAWLRAHLDEIPYIRMGRFRRYRQADLDAYLARKAVDPDPLGRSSRSKQPVRRAS